MDKGNIVVVGKRKRIVLISTQILFPIVASLGMGALIIIIGYWELWDFPLTIGIAILCGFGMGFAIRTLFCKMIENDQFILYENGLEMSYPGILAATLGEPRFIPFHEIKAFKRGTPLRWFHFFDKNGKRQNLNIKIFENITEDIIIEKWESCKQYRERLHG